MLEIKFCGRGGQGAVLASQILAWALFKMGMYPQCFSVFGGERRGAPVESYLRVDREKIRLRCGIKSPDHLIVMATDLITPDLLSTVKRQGLILVNAEVLPEAVREFQKNFDLAVIDAQGVAARIGLGRALNTAVLGAYCKAHGGIPLEFLEEAIKAIIPAKVEENILAAHMGYEEVKVHRCDPGGLQSGA